MTPTTTVTGLHGNMRDDAERHGNLTRLQLLGLTIIDVHRLGN